MKNLLLALGLASSLQAFGFVDLPNQKSPWSAATKAQCADFSGDWKGVCTDSKSSHKMPVEWVFVQKDCSTLDTGLRLVALGGQLTVTYGEGSGKLTSHSITSTWNQTRTELSIVTMAAGPTGIDPYSTTSGSIKLKNSRTMILTSGRLDLPSYYTCELTK